jgi:DNA-binding PadR family transcriptional regulator
MATSTKKPDQFLPLTPRIFHILLALKDGTQHGYAIMKEVESRSEGRVRIGPGTLYEGISRLVKGGLLREVKGGASAIVDRRRRRFYKLTALGRKVMRLEAQRMADLVGFVREAELLVGG